MTKLSPKPSAKKVGFGLHISTDIERRLARCRASIRDQLQEIALVAERSSGRARRSERKEPPLRFYIHESYRVFYQVDPVARRIVVLDFAPA